MTGDKASPGFWLMFAAAIGIIAAIVIYRSGRTIETREQAVAASRPESHPAGPTPGPVLISMQTTITRAHGRLSP